MTTPAKPFVGMSPALYWSAGGNTFEVDDPRFYQWINTPGTVVRLWLSDPLAKTTTVSYDGGESGQMATYEDSYHSFGPGRVFGRDERIVVDGPVWLAVSTPDAGLTMTDIPQQTNLTPYAYGDSTYFMLVLTPDGRASPYWTHYHDDSQSWGEWFVESALVVWGGAFAVAAVAGAATISTAVPVVAGESAVPAVVGESVVSSASTAAGGGELIASDFVGPVATGGTAAGGTVAASATAGTTAATTGSAAFSMSDIMGAAKATVAVAGAASKIEQAISGAPVAPAPPAPTSAPPKPPDNSWLALLGVAVILVLPP